MQVVCGLFHKITTALLNSNDETMALPPIRVKRTNRLSTGFQHSLTITSKH